VNVSSLCHRSSRCTLPFVGCLTTRTIPSLPSEPSAMRIRSGGVSKIQDPIIGSWSAFIKLAEIAVENKFACDILCTIMLPSIAGDRQVLPVSGALAESSSTARLSESISFGGKTCFIHANPYLFSAERSVCELEGWNGKDVYPFIWVSSYGRCEYRQVKNSSLGALSRTGPDRRNSGAAVCPTIIISYSHYIRMAGVLAFGSACELVSTDTLKITAPACIDGFV
jgi:hypothetical protein